MIRTVKTETLGCEISFNFLQRYRDRLQPYAEDRIPYLFFAFYPKTGKRLVAPGGDDFFLAAPNTMTINPRSVTMVFTNKNPGLAAMHQGHYLGKVYGTTEAVTNSFDNTTQENSIVRVDGGATVWQPGQEQPATVTEFMSLYTHHFTEAVTSPIEEGRAMGDGDSVVAIINPKNFDGIN